MTVVAATFAYKFYMLQFEHPLAVIPDLVGEYRNATQRKGGAHTVPMPKPDQPLPSHLITSLGAPLTVGQIEVTPLSIRLRPWTAFAKRKDGAEIETVPIKATFVLTLRIKNVSADALIYAMDPFFDRRADDDDRALPFTLIEAGDKKYFGGVLEYNVDAARERTWLAGRENDAEPLKPGKTRDVVLVTRPAFAAAIADALAKSGSEAIWRVQVRRGFYEFKDQEFSVAAVIGVRFTHRDIATA
jgi:hypothetical protein